MAKKINPIYEGYFPKGIEKKGYQPQKPGTPPESEPDVQGGYIPTGSGDNPANDPTPPGDE